jgi:hypothetical protein
MVRAIKKAGEDHGRVSDEEFWKLAEQVMTKTVKNPDCN